jgi:hypothetical protein
MSGYHCYVMAEPLSTWNIFLPLITGVGGYVGGILSEPLKQITTQYLARRSMKRIVYTELAHNMDSLITLVDNDDEARSNLIYRKALDLNLSYKTFDFAESQPLVFHQLPEATNIRNIYSGFHHFLDQAVTSLDIIAGIETLLRRCDVDIIDGDLDGKQLEASKLPALTKRIHDLRNKQKRVK